MSVSMAAGAARVDATASPAAGTAELTVHSNPLLTEWTGRFGGVPPFDRVSAADFAPALQQAMAASLAEVTQIAADPAAPTFENTLVPLELSGAPLARAQAVYNVWKGTLNSGGFQAVEAQIEPKLAQYNTQILQNGALFARLRALYESPAKAQLSAEQQRLIWVYYDNFTRAGANLAAAPKARVGAINERLASLFTRFTQNLLAEEESHTLFLKSEAELAGLPAPVRESAAQAAADAGRPGQWAIVNTRSSVEPFLTYSERRDLREKVWRTFYSRGDNGDAHDNKAVITEILQLRAERARLLGFATHAHWRVANAMAKTPENAMALMMQVWPAAVARVHDEVADMQVQADLDKTGVSIAAWDYRFYAEKVRKARYDLDMNEVKPYLQLEKLREAMFYVAGKLYGFQFEAVSDLPVAHPDVRVWEVKDAQGAHVGLWYFDPYARPGKRSGAWMSEYRAQRRLARTVTPIVSNNSNFIKGRPGEPVLVSWDDAITLFHEFGHALHGLNSNVVYATLAGTNTATDFVEFPSQLNEKWLMVPEVLQRFAVHYQTGAPLPPALLDKLKQADAFNQGFKTVEYLASALVDMKLHLSTQASIDPAAFERSTLAELGMPAEMAMRHRLPQFSHLFAGDDYAGGYYSYLWSQVLDHDAYEAFEQASGPFDAAVARRLHDTIMSVGNTVDPAQAYRNFRGRDPQIGALLRSRGFAAPPSPSSTGKQ